MSCVCHLSLTSCTKKKNHDKCSVCCGCFRTCNTKKQRLGWWATLIIVVLQVVQRKTNHDNGRCACHHGLKACNTKKKLGRRTQLVILVLQVEWWKRKTPRWAPHSWFSSLQHKKYPRWHACRPSFRCSYNEKKPKMTSCNSSSWFWKQEKKTRKNTLTFKANALLDVLCP